MLLEIKKLYNILNCIRRLNKLSQNDKTSWTNWYEKLLRDKIKFAIAKRFLNLDKLKKNAMPLVISSEDRKVIRIKDITLPLVERGIDYNTFLTEIVDICSEYLLNDKLTKRISPPYSEGPYEYQEVRCDEGDVVIDAGANIGTFSAFAGRKTGGGYRLCI